MVTHRQEADREGICFWKGELTALTNKLKAECTGNVWICGGAAVAGQLLKEGRIDQLWLSMIPVVLGKGIRLFPELPDPFFCFLVQFPVKLSGPFLILRGQLFFLFRSLCGGGNGPLFDL